MVAVPCKTSVPWLTVVSPLFVVLAVRDNMPVLVFVRLPVPKIVPPKVLLFALLMVSVVNPVPDAVPVMLVLPKSIKLPAPPEMPVNTRLFVTVVESWLFKRLLPLPNVEGAEVVCFAAAIVVIKNVGATAL